MASTVLIDVLVVTQGTLGVKGNYPLRASYRCSFIALVGYPYRPLVPNKDNPFIFTTWYPVGPLGGPVGLDTLVYLPLAGIHLILAPGVIPLGGPHGTPYRV